MKPINFFLTTILFVSIEGCLDFSDDYEGNPELANTQWDTAYLLDSAGYTYFDFNSSGNGGLVYYYTDSSCFQSCSMKVTENKIIFGGTSHPYNKFGDRFRIDYPLYDASNPDKIVGYFSIPLKQINLDTVNISLCE